jgi:hypothetical protein
MSPVQRKTRYHAPEALNDRGETPFDQWLFQYLDLIERLSLWLDLESLTKTASAVLCDPGAA